MNWVGAPTDTVAWACLVAALALLLPPVRRAACRAVFDSSQAVYVSGIALLSFASSVAYVHTYLGGMPRIIDATTYLLEARTFASGQFAFTPPGPLSAFSGRFLIVTPNQQLAAIFPPGYPAILALGVWLGHPLLVNPTIGAALSVGTSELGRRWFEPRVGRLAGVLSTFCVTLRYHSADTMSHAWSALLVVGTLLCATHRSRQIRWAVLAGICAGMLFATRPLTGVVLGLGAGLGLLWAYAKATRAVRITHLAAFVLGLLPGLLLWGSYQWLNTGQLATTQSLYYARSDFPSGCFRLGFGANVGCQHEHGDFLAKYQPFGFGAVEALATTARRLAMHHIDIANFPGFGALALFSVGHMRRVAKLRTTWLLIGAQILAYAAFYFDGNYPGGGARFFVEVLPLEHVLLSWVLIQWRLPTLGLAANWIGFAIAGSHLSQALHDREGARPMFEPSVVSGAGVDRGIVFFDTDHGFNLAFDPRYSSANSHIVAARYRGDASDRALWERQGRPPAYRYRFDPFARQAVPRLEPYTPGLNPLPLGAHLWPPVSTRGGSTAPTSALTCDFSPGLVLVPSGLNQRTVVEVPVSHAGSRSTLTLRWQ